MEIGLRGHVRHNLSGRMHQKRLGVLDPWVPREILSTLRHAVPPLCSRSGLPCSVASLRRFPLPQPPGRVHFRGPALAGCALGRDTPSTCFEGFQHPSTIHQPCSRSGDRKPLHLPATYKGQPSNWACTLSYRWSPCGMLLSGIVLTCCCLGLTPCRKQTSPNRVCFGSMCWSHPWIPCAGIGFVPCGLPSS